LVQVQIIALALGDCHGGDQVLEFPAFYRTRDSHLEMDTLNSIEKEWNPK